MQNQNHTGQSLVEYIMLLALITIVAVSLVAGLGQSSSEHLAQASDAISEADIAAATATKASSAGVSAASHANGKTKPRSSATGN